MREEGREGEDRKGQGRGKGRRGIVKCWDGGGERTWSTPKLKLHP